jgi:flagellar biosynthesis/type III secretory pathway protein FliH
MNTAGAAPDLRELLRGTRVLAPAAVAELPLLAGEAATLRQRLAAKQALRLALLDALVEAARQHGYRDGHAQSLREWQHARTRLDAWQADADGALQALLLQALRRLLGELPPDVPAALLAQQALRAAADEQGRLRVCVHPTLRDAVAARLLAAGCPHEVHADDTCAPSACRIDTAFGSLHGDWQTQLAALADALGNQPA